MTFNRIVPVTDDVSSEDPVILLKPESVLFCGKSAYELPNLTKEYHYETELAFRMCKTGKDISTAQTFNYVDAVTIGIDVIARDLQRLFRTKGGSWDILRVLIIVQFGENG